MPTPQPGHGIPLRSLQRHSPSRALATPEQSVGSHASISRRSPPARNAQTLATVTSPQSTSSGNEAEVATNLSQASRASPAPQSNNQRQPQATSTTSSSRWKTWLLLATDTRVIGSLALLVTLAILWPTFRSLVFGEDAVALAEWTAMKDYREYCKDEAATGHGSLDPDCTKVLKAKLLPPPNTSRSLATRRLDPSLGGRDSYNTSDGIILLEGLSLLSSSISIPLAFTLGALLCLRILRPIIISQIWPVQSQRSSYGIGPDGDDVESFGYLQKGQAPDAQLPLIQEQRTHGGDSHELQPPELRNSVLYAAPENSKHRETAKSKLPNPAPFEFGHDRNYTSSHHQLPRWTLHSQWFQPGEGIDRVVITADIQCYLGPGALVKPGNVGGVSGYIITAYRALTSDMVADLKCDSRRWRDELMSRCALHGDDAARLSGQDHGPPPPYRVDSSRTLQTASQPQQFANQFLHNSNTSYTIPGFGAEAAYTGEPATANAAQYTYQPATYDFNRIYPYTNSSAYTTQQSSGFSGENNRESRRRR